MWCGKRNNHHQRHKPTRFSRTKYRFLRSNERCAWRKKKSVKGRGWLGGGRRKRGISTRFLTKGKPGEGRSHSHLKRPSEGVGRKKKFEGRGVVGGKRGACDSRTIENAKYAALQRSILYTILANNEGVWKGERSARKTGGRHSREKVRTHSQLWTKPHIKRGNLF